MKNSERREFLKWLSENEVAFFTESGTAYLNGEILIYDELLERFENRTRTIFKVGDTVYFWGTQFGQFDELMKGQISKIGELTLFVKVSNGSEFIFTGSGKVNEDMRVPLLSFTPYTPIWNAETNTLALEGFSQKRPESEPKKNAPPDFKVGELVLVSSVEEEWLIRPFVRFDRNGLIITADPDGLEYRWDYAKKIQILDEYSA